MSTLRLRVEAEPLKSFRLSDVPESIRKAGALKVADEQHRALKPERGDRVRRPAAETEKWAAIGEASKAMRAALRPSNRVRWISQRAWDEMIAEAAKLEKKAAVEKTKRVTTLAAGETEFVEALA